MWVQYYNHRRPHQGIGDLCPADRFYEIQHALRQTIEAGLQENLLEMALRGKPRDPFYMVGRMGEQLVVIRAEKGKLRMTVDADGEEEPRELVYDMKEDKEDDPWRGPLICSGQDGFDDILLILSFYELSR